MPSRRGGCHFGGAISKPLNSNAGDTVQPGAELTDDEALAALEQRLVKYLRS